jgi:hypothetical protein
MIVAGAQIRWCCWSSFFTPRDEECGARDENKQPTRILTFYEDFLSINLKKEPNKNFSRISR